jgi:hypothetical protein
MLNPRSDRKEGSASAHSRRLGGKLAAIFIIVSVIFLPLESASAQSSTDASATKKSNVMASPASPISPDQADATSETSTAQPSATEQDSGGTSVVASSNTTVSNSPPALPPSPEPPQPATTPSVSPQVSSGVSSETTSNIVPSGRNGKGTETLSGGNPPEVESED